ncbi:MAG: M56 family metallopeptidase [Armatimonadota bacterium]|jgi:beta-lactamase regulating signal transducer with metallopeptidase domain
MTMTTLIADIALAVTVVLGLGSVAALVLRRCSPALRHAAWRATLAGVWLAPLAVIAAGMLPVQRPQIAVPVPRYEPAPAPVAEAPSAPVEEPTAPAPGVAPAAEPAPAPREPLPIAAILLSLWGAGALVALVAFGRDASALRTLLAEGAPSDRPATVEAIAQRLGLARLPRVRRSAEVSVPAVAGWLRPTLVLPEDRPADEAALIHELAHVQRGDVPTLAAARLTAAVWWWHPLAWLMLRGLAATAEEACDDVVLALTGARREYAQMLTDWAERTSVSGAVNCGSHGKGLVARVRRVLDERVKPVVTLSNATRLIVVVSALVAILAAGTIHVRAQTAADDIDPAAALPPIQMQEVTVTGTVVGPDGSPVPGAIVFATHSDRSGLRPIAGATETTTGEDGRFRLVFTSDYDPPRSYPVVARVEGRALQWAMATNEEEVEIQLGTAGVTCSGTVTDPDGRPVRGAYVFPKSIYARDPDPTVSAAFLSPWPEANPLGVTTDGSGRFRIDGLPPQAHVALMAVAEGFAHTRADAVPASSVGLSIELEREGRIEGRVMRDGRGVSGITVGAGWGFAVTGEEGHYSIGSQPAGTWTARVRDPEWTSNIVHGIQVEEGQTVRSVDIELLRPAVVRGRVLKADDGEPAPGARIAASVEHPEGSKTVASEAANEGGHYTLVVPPGDCHVYYQGTYPGYPYGDTEPLAHDLSLSEGETRAHVDFELLPGDGGGE